MIVDICSSLLSAHFSFAHSSWRTVQKQFEGRGAPSSPSSKAIAQIEDMRPNHSPVASLNIWNLIGFHQGF